MNLLLKSIQGMSKSTHISLVSGNFDLPDFKNHFSFTDMDISKYFIHQHGQNLRFCHGTKSWYVFDGTHWIKDDTGEVMRLAKNTVQTIKNKCQQISDKTLRKTMEKYDRSCQNLMRLKAMIETSQSESEVIVKEDDFDSNPNIFACKDGIIDLMTMDLQKSNPNLLISRISPVHFAENQNSVEWQSFLEESTCGDKELEEFIQRAVGYSLFGSNDEEKLFFIYEPGASGKSTFIEAIKMLFGDYAKIADFSSFLRNHSLSRPRDDLARLKGARIVIANEVYRGAKLSEAIIKRLTGNDTIVARALYQEAVEWRPQFTLWFVANDPPIADKEDDAIWRRILCIPFSNSVPDNLRNPNLKKSLCDPQKTGPSILNWALQGCLKYQEKGLNPPNSVIETTEAYRQEGDQIDDWITEACYESFSAFSSSADIFDSYLSWAMDHTLKPISQKALSINHRSGS